MEKKSLFPVIRAPEFFSPGKKEELVYQPGIAFDIQTGDFVRDGSHKLGYSTGKEAFRLWCYKMAVTERHACLAYPGRYGTEMENARREPDEKAVESALQRTITEALQVNPRTEYVRDFSFTWEGDRLICRFYVKGINMEEFPITIETEKRKDGEADGKGI